MPLNSSLNLKQSQQAFTHAIRTGEYQGFDSTRLAVYARLVRNNCLGFIDRCFTETPAHCGKQWEEVKERFIREGKAQSPYFQDIAAEFLHFCQINHCFSKETLALMDFEQTQLQAEVALAHVPSSEKEWHEHSLMELSQAAFLREYEVNFLTSHFKEIVTEPMQALIWRDHLYNVYYRQLESLDFWLLSYLAEQPSSLHQLIQALNKQLTNHPNQRLMLDLLKQAWQSWIEADVILLK